MVKLVRPDNLTAEQSLAFDAWDQSHECAEVLALSTQAKVDRIHRRLKWDGTVTLSAMVMLIIALSGAIASGARYLYNINTKVDSITLIVAAGKARDERLNKLDDKIDALTTSVAETNAALTGAPGEADTTMKRLAVLLAALAASCADYLVLAPPQKIPAAAPEAHGVALAPAPALARPAAIIVVAPGPRRACHTPSPPAFPDVASAPGLIGHDKAVTESLAVHAAYERRLVAALRAC